MDCKEADLIHLMMMFRHSGKEQKKKCQKYLHTSRWNFGSPASKLLISRLYFVLETVYIWKIICGFPDFSRAKVQALSKRTHNHTLLYLYNCN